MKLHFYFHLIFGYLIKYTNTEYENVEVQNSQRKRALLDGNFTIGALFPIHQTPYTRIKSPFICGSIHEQYGVQRVEASFFTLDQINSSPHILPNITLGIDIRDSCWSSPALALHQSLQFIQNHSCSGDFSNEVCSRNNSQIIAVIGPASSEGAIQVQNLLNIFKIPQVGYSSTSPYLSDKSKFGYFVRVIPPHDTQALIMVQILLKYNWTYVFAVNTAGEYGFSGIAKFLALAREHNICIVEEIHVEDALKDNEYDKIARKLYKNEKANVAVCFCDGYTIKHLMLSIKRLNLSGSLVIIGSDAWSRRKDLLVNADSAAQGSLIVDIHSPNIDEFDEYYLNLPYNQSRNPWFKEFWETRFNCSFQENTSNSRLCTGNESLRNNYFQDPKLAFIIKSIYAIAYALDNYIKDVFANNVENVFSIDGTLFLKYLRNVSFSYKNETISFDENGDPTGKYDIYNYQYLGKDVYEYVKVGQWIDGNLELNTTKIQLPKHVNAITSVCSGPCLPGYRKEPLITGNMNDTCCWNCYKCKPEEISNDTHCSSCKQGYKPNLDQSDCIELVIEYAKWTDASGIVCSAFSAIGVILTCATVLSFLMYRKTPVVRSSTKELCYIMFISMLFSHFCVLLIIGKPTIVTCTFIRIVPGVSLCGMYSALLVKTNRIYRIFSMSKNGFPQFKPKLISTRSQIVICAGLILSEIVICMVYLYIEPIKLELSIWQGTHKNMTFDRVILECYSSSVMEELCFPFVFNAVLLLMCTFYAFKTRNLPNNFKETKCIGFACYATIITWAAFVSVYLGSVHQALSYCFSLSTSALIILVFLFFPKLYILYWRPERNTRANFKTTKNLRWHIGSNSIYRQVPREVNKSNALVSYSHNRAEIHQIFYKLHQQCIKNPKSLDNSNIKNKSCQTSFNNSYISTVNNEEELSITEKKVLDS